MLILVVGPSGAGKDTLLKLARDALVEDLRFRFVRRVITRPADPSGEDHEAVSEAAFAQRVFALHWQAHGLYYGIPLDIINDVTRGIVVVANVSRGVIAEAADRFPIRVLEVTAPPEILALRLAQRGRETAEDIAKRLARAGRIPNHVLTDVVMNDKTPAEGAAQFTAALIRAASRVQPG